MAAAVEESLPDLLDKIEGVVNIPGVPPGATDKEHSRPLTPGPSPRVQGEGEFPSPLSLTGERGRG